MNAVQTKQMSRSDDAKAAVGFSPRFKRGYVTPAFVALDRGLKPAATFTSSLREQFRSAAK